MMARVFCSGIGCSLAGLSFTVGWYHYILMNKAASDIDPFGEPARHFPILDKVIYANHAAMSPWPRVTAQAVEHFAIENAEQGPLSYSLWLKRETELRGLLARMLNAPGADDIALSRNTTEGVCVVANGLEWREGDNIVTVVDEFLSNQMAWDELKSLGVQIRRVDIRASLDPEAELASRLDRHTRVLSVSAVQWNDGFRLELPRLGRACRDNGTLFFVDAIQQFGAMPLDVQACHIDCLSAGSHKWQMGPEGMGVFYCHRKIRPKLRLRQFGWRMLDDPYRLERPDRLPSDSARRFETGSPNSMGQVALLASLDLIHQTGQEEIARRVLDNTARLLDGIKAIPGVRLQSRSEPERRSGIVSFVPTSQSAIEFNTQLKRQKVICAIRGKAIRLSPHFYQHDVQIADLLNAVEHAAQG